MKWMRMIMAFMVNAMIGATAASALGAPLALGAVGALMAGPLVGGGVGALNASVLTEVWTGELIKQLRSADKGTFLDGIPDYSRYADNDVIHMINVGGDPKVLTNNTTYPLQITAITDTDAVFKLDKFQTEATPITDDELYALSYDKMASVKERHGLAILEAKLKKAIHALAPASNTATTPVIKTTGEVEDGGATGRKRLTRHDIIEMKKRFDLMSVPTEGRRLVLCPEHIADLLEMDQKFADQYYNYASGRISMLYGFEVYEYVAGPVYNLTGAKQALGTAPVVGSIYQASVAFHTSRVFKATGSTTFYYSEAKNDPQYQRSLVNYRHYFVVLPKKVEAIGAIISDKK